MCRADHDDVLVLTAVVVVTTVAREWSDKRGGACHRRPAERELDDRGAQPQGQRGIDVHVFHLTFAGWSTAKIRSS